MLMKKILLFLLITFLIIQQLAVLPGCANIIPPTGGPRDSLPPVLVKATPPDSTSGFKSKTITFTFDEYVELQNIQENLLVSPTPEKAPVLESKLRTVTVKIKDTLEANTTYVYDFGNAIKDVNEGNVFKNFTYIFTTGNILDSLELSGKVLLAETGGIDTTLIVMLHTSGVDSSVVKERPRYIAKLDGKGFFHFRYMPAGTYYIYALKDESGTKTYLRKDQLFAFADDPVEIKSGAQPVTLYASAEKKEAPKATVTLGSGRGGLNRGDERRLRFTTNLTSGQQDLLKTFAISFDIPLKNFDSSKLVLSTDSTFIPEKSYSWEIDSTNKKISLKINWKEGTRYNLILDKEFAQDTLGHKLLKTDTLNFITRKLADYATIKINFNNFDTLNNPVLQFVQGNQIVNSFPLSSAIFSQALFTPGEYELRVLNDKNKNGIWDAGDFFNNHRQPELVKPVNNKITIKANWDNEFEITL